MKRKKFIVALHDPSGAVLSAVMAHAFNSAKNKHGRGLIRKLGGNWNMTSFEGEREGSCYVSCFQIWERDGDGKRVTLTVNRID